MGLNKLKDINAAKENRSKVFDSIIRKKLDYSKISKSKYVSEIEDRFEPLANIEKLFDDNKIVFRYNEKANKISIISADFLLATPFRETEVYIFLNENEDKNYFCRSFFPKSKRDYTQGQTKYTLLYKEKKNMKTGQVEIQWDSMDTGLQQAKL